MGLYPFPRFRNYVTRPVIFLEEITLAAINKSKNTISYHFRATDGLRDYFTSAPFVIEYPENIESVPDSIAAIPFVSNVLPIVWLTNSILRVNELDQSFLECIPDVRHGYETMFPESTFSGKIVAQKIVPSSATTTNGCAVFFSGGLDATQTLISHLHENPILISIWGADIRYENLDGWKAVYRGIQESAQAFGLHDVVIRSTFREFDDEKKLTQRFAKQLKDGWWHGVKHGIGLLGHAAPYAYLKGLRTVYIAASNCPDDGPVRCASNPLTDNFVRFSDIHVVHDGFEFSRQDKVRNIVQYVHKTGNQVHLHVCWESQAGNNCCHCEKCYRTMVGLIAEGADPICYGFSNTANTIHQMKAKIACEYVNYNVFWTQWKYIKNRIIENKYKLYDSTYWESIKCIEKIDFTNQKSFRPPIFYRIRKYLSRFQFYQYMHNIKGRFFA